MVDDCRTYLLPSSFTELSLHVANLSSAALDSHRRPTAEASRSVFYVLSPAHSIPFCGYPLFFSLSSSLHHYQCPLPKLVVGFLPLVFTSTRLPSCVRALRIPTPGGCGPSDDIVPSKQVLSASTPQLASTISVGRSRWGWTRHRTELTAGVVHTLTKANAKTEVIGHRMDSLGLAISRRLIGSSRTRFEGD